jgi:cation transport protein ChaC
LFWKNRSLKDSNHVSPGELLMELVGNQDQVEWIFGYGSLIWRPGFDSASVQQARLGGYERRFWQASHDHRGTPESPGRVVTLAPVGSSYCDGLAYQLPLARREAILKSLDEREQDGYQRVYLDLDVANGRRVKGLTWIALEGNPSWVGQEAPELVAQLIATRCGPSGTNREYLYCLNEALCDLGISDPYISMLTGHVERFSKSVAT